MVDQGISQDYKSWLADFQQYVTQQDWDDEARRYMWDNKWRDFGPPDRWNVKGDRTRRHDLSIISGYDSIPEAFQKFASGELPPEIRDQILDYLGYDQGEKFPHLEGRISRSLRVANVPEMYSFNIRDYLEDIIDNVIAQEAARSSYRGVSRDDILSFLKAPRVDISGFCWVKAWPVSGRMTGGIDSGAGMLGQEVLHSIIHGNINMRQEARSSILTLNAWPQLCDLMANLSRCLFFAPFALLVTRASSSLNRKGKSAQSSRAQNFAYHLIDAKEFNEKAANGDYNQLLTWNAKCLLCGTINKDIVLIDPKFPCEGCNPGSNPRHSWFQGRHFDRDYEVRGFSEHHRATMGISSATHSLRSMTWYPVKSPILLPKDLDPETVERFVCKEETALLSRLIPADTAKYLASQDLLRVSSVLLAGRVGGFFDQLVKTRRKRAPSVATPIQNNTPSDPTRALFSTSSKEDNSGEVSRALYAMPVPDQTDEMTDLIKMHKQGDRFPYVGVVGHEGESIDSRRANMLAIKPNLNARNLPRIEVEGCRLISIEGAFDMEQLLKIASQNHRAPIPASGVSPITKDSNNIQITKPYVHIRKITGLYTPNMSSTTHFCNFHMSIEDTRMIAGANCGQSNTMVSNQEGVMEMGCDYCVARDDLGKYVLKYQLERELVTRGSQWGTMSLFFDITESDLPYQSSKLQALAVYRMPLTSLIEREVNPDSSNIAFTPKDLSMLRQLYLQGDIDDVDAPKTERLKKSSYSKSTLRGAKKGELIGGPKREGWEHVAEARKPKLDAMEASVSAESGSTEDASLNMIAKAQWEQEQERLRKEFAEAGRAKAIGHKTSTELIRVPKVAFVNEEKKEVNPKNLYPL